MISAAFAVYALGTMALVAWHGEDYASYEALLPFFGAGLLAIGLRTAALPRAREWLREGDHFRKAFWSEPVRAAREEPWSGVGRVELARRLDRAALSVRPYASHEHPPREAHNEYLDTLAARGVPGLVFLAPAFLVPLALFLRLRRDGPDPRAAAETGILLLAIFAAAGLTDALSLLNAKRMTFLFFVLFCAMEAASAKSAPRGN